MKFIAQQTARIALDGIHIVGFIKGIEYDLPEKAVAELQKRGIAPSGEATPNKKAANPVTENKMANPVTDNKLKLNK